MMDTITTILKRLAVLEDWYKLSSAEMRDQVIAGKLVADDKDPDGRAIGSWLVLYGRLLALQELPPVDLAAVPPEVEKWLDVQGPVVGPFLRSRLFP